MKNPSPLLKREVQSLNPHEPITFIEIVMEDAQGNPFAFRLTDAGTRIWRGNTWSNTPFQIVGNTYSSDGELSRPKLNLPNMDGQYSFYVDKGFLERAIVTRFRVSPLELEVGSFDKQVFFISQVVSLTRDILTVELRKSSDGNAFRLSGTRYEQPEYGTVVL